MPHFAVAAVGADRPGIVAAVTAVFVDQGCNLQDTSMTILGGHFAMMLVVDAPQGTVASELEAALAGPASSLDLVVMVRSIVDLPPVVPVAGESDVDDDERWTVSVYGADRPGIVHAVASTLASLGVNIVDLSTRVIGDPDRPVYAMVMEVALPDTVRASALGERLAELGDELEVSCSLHPSEADIL